LYFSRTESIPQTIARRPKATAHPAEKNEVANIVKELEVVTKDKKRRNFIFIFLEKS